MSAPHEVWILGNEWFNTSVTRYCGNDAGTRYLRADLVCGECAKIDDEYPCECRGCLTTDDYDRPACMAFVPREVAK